MSDAPKSGYPLAWPIGRPRTDNRVRAQFKVSMATAIADMQFELKMLRAVDVVISTNQELRRDGLPRGDRGPPRDPGVAVYFNRKKRPMCIACDRWSTIDDNMRAVGKTLEAIRSIERWGSGSMVEAAFAGFTALPAPEQPWQILGVKHDASKAEIEAAFRALAQKWHPDRNAGDEYQFKRVSTARDRMIEDLA